MDSLQGLMGFWSITEDPLKEVISYLKKHFGKKFVVYVGRSDLPFSYLIRLKHMDIDTEIRVRAAYEAAEMLVKMYGSETARSWFFGMNTILDNNAPAYVIRHASSLGELREVILAANHFCFPS